MVLIRINIENIWKRQTKSGRRLKIQPRRLLLPCIRHPFPLRCRPFSATTRKGRSKFHPILPAALPGSPWPDFCSSRLNDRQAETGKYENLVCELIIIANYKYPFSSNHCTASEMLCSKGRWLRPRFSLALVQSHHE